MKSSSAKRISLLLLAVLFFSAALFAEDISLRNWAVPPYHASSTSGGLTTMGFPPGGTAFVVFAPCRLVDTRQAGFPAGYGPPALSQGAPRNFDLNSDPLCPGIPTGLEAYSLNITVTNTQGPGFIKIYPQGGSVPFDVSTQNYVAGQTIANAAIVPAGIGGGITVVAGVSGTDLIIDINGYFTSVYNNQTSFNQVGNVSGGPLGFFHNQSTTESYAVQGFSASTTIGGAGVYGSANGGDPASGTCADCRASGVRGASISGHGVLGVSSASGIAGGVTGIFIDPSFNEYPDSVGILGFSSATGVRSQSNISKAGMVFFTEPHATDASKKIVYAALEGNEGGTYFRGRGKFQNGTAKIDPPEDFRMVTEPEGLSIQVTPIGEMATVAVAQIGLDRIVVKGSRNVEFFYTVNGIRRGYADFRPIVANDKDYLPASADARLPDFRPEIRNRLVANGTYRPDGTVNTETAQRLGWDRIWEERSRPQPQPAQPPP